ncbi:MAG: phosphoethanolamine transferase [Algoriella sp.]
MKKKAFLVLAVFLLLIPDLLFNYINNSFLEALVIILSKITIFLILLLLISFLTKSYYRSSIIVGSVYLFSMLGETTNIVVLKQYLTMDNLKALVYTNTNESFEFVSNFKWLFFSLLLFLCFIIYLIKESKRLNLKFEISKNFKILGICFFVLLICIFIRLKNSEQFDSGKNLLKYSFKQYILKEHPFNLYYRTYEVFYYKRKTDNLKEKRHKFSFQVTKSTSKTESPDIVVFVIGEGMRSAQWNSNGYHRMTSPELNKIKNLISYKNHFSNGNSTSASIPLIITEATPENANLSFSEKSILSLYKEAGYETNWISSQNIFYLENENEPDHIFKIFEKKSHTDLDVLPVLKSVAAQKSKKKKFILINLIGNHGTVPESFKLFKPNAANAIEGIKSKNALINQYDNKILLQDYVLSQIIKCIDLKDQKAFLMFTADHGVNLYDTKNETLFGYGSSNPTKYELNIPMFFWGSTNYCNIYKDKIEQLKANQTKRTVNNNLFYTLSDLSNITYKGFLANKSFCNSKFKENEFISVYMNGSSLKYNYRN